MSCDDVKSSAFLLVPHIEELLDVEPQWQSGMTGVMQVIVLMLIAESATSRT